MTSARLPALLPLYDVPVVTGAPSTRLGEWKIILAFATVTAIWGSTWIVIRDQLGPVPPSWSVTYRFLLAGIVMLGFARFRRERLALDAAGWRFALALGALQFCLNFNFVYRAEGYITSGLVAVVFALLLIPNSLFGWLLIGQPIRRETLLGSIIAMTGVGMMIAYQANATAHSAHALAAGVSLTLLGVLSASLANILQATQTARRYPMVPTLGVAMLLGAALDAIFAWSLTGPPVIEWRVGYLLGVAYLGIIASAVAFTLYFGVLRKIGATRAAYSSVIIPVIAMVISTLVEGYRWGPVAIIGAVLALGGLMLAITARKPARKSA
ncbi:MAG: DMT family transporter [Sphingomonas sp.]|jgi:drug/metabolite transporter (DMT)-like permease